MDSVLSVLKCIKDDRALSFLPGWVNKFPVAIKILSEGVPFDQIAFKLKSEADQKAAAEKATNRSI